MPGLASRQPPPLPDDEAIWQIQTAGQALLAEQGFQAYEISAYCRADYACQHNKNYWLFGDYLGIGAGAHSKITTANQIQRFSNVNSPRAYMNINTPTQADPHILNHEDKILEFMMNALRLRQAIPLALFEARTGLSRQHLNAPLALATEQGLLHQDQQYLHVTSRGQRLLNELLGLFLP